MPSFSRLLTSLTGFGFGYFRDSRHAARTFDQQGIASIKTVPRMGFQYFVTMNLNPIGSELLEEYKLKEDFPSLFPLVKSVDLPSIKIDTDLLNEYNRKRISQTKINFDPIKMTFHDVVDGRTMKLWQMYYEFYFKDGTPFNTDEQKTQSDDIANPTTFTDKFGYNLTGVEDSRYLIRDIEIVQIHAAKFNKVTLVNPRISSMSPSGLAYENSTTTDFTVTIEYEYLRYDIKNEPLTDDDLELFRYGEFMDLPTLAFTSAVNDRLSGVNPLLKSDNPVAQRVGRNLQSSLGNVLGASTSGVTRGATSSALDGLANISPTPVNPTPIPKSNPRNFNSKAPTTSNNFKDTVRSKFGF
jgi:hypothetical protein